MSEITPENIGLYSRVLYLRHQAHIHRRLTDYIWQKLTWKVGTKCSNWCNLPAMGNAYLKEPGLSELHWEYSRWSWKKARKSTHCFINKEITKKQNYIYESFPSIHASQLSFPSNCLKILIENLLKHVLLIQLAWKWHPMPLNKQSLFKSFIISHNKNIKFRFYVKN